MPEAKLSMKLANPPVKSSKISLRCTAHGSRLTGHGSRFKARPFWVSFLTFRVPCAVCLGPFPACLVPCTIFTLLDRKGRGT